MALRIKLGESGAFGEQGPQIAERIQTLGRVQEVSTTAEYLRLVMDYQGDAQPLEHLIESVDNNIEVVSMGYQLEIVKQVPVAGGMGGGSADAAAAR